MATRERKARVKTDLENGVLHFEFLGAKDKDGNPTVAHRRSFPLEKIPSALHTALALHGLKQKLSDSFADPDAEPVESSDAVFAQLTSGTWSQRGEAGPRTSILEEAIAALKGADLEKVREFVAKQDDDWVKAIKKDPAVKAKMDEIAAKKAAEKAKASKAAAKNGTSTLEGINI